MKSFNTPGILRTRKSKIIASVLLLIVGGVLTYLILNGKGPVADVPVPGQKYYSQLTGQEVSREESNRPILGVIIENSEEARPQTGLDSAGIVFETVTEGGITRYLALFQENMPDQVGPIRSVRPYFVDWLMGFDTSIAHVGGSEEALQLINDRKAKSINEFFNGDLFFRTNDREAPHNVYAKTKVLTDKQEEDGHKKSVAVDFMRTEDVPNVTPTATNISINFSFDIFAVTFAYDKATNRYARSLASKPHLDAATNKQITVKNLVVLKMVGEINALGEGAGVLYKDGVSQEIKWRQNDFNTRLELLDGAGNPVALNRGDTWISVIPGDGTLTQQ